MLKRCVLLALPLAIVLSGALPAWAGGAPPVAGSVANFSRIDPPRPAPDASFRDSAGKTLRLADFRGKLVLLNIWATWCAPCRAEMPSLDRLQARLGGKGLVVLPLSLDRGGGPAVAVFYGQQDITHLGVYLDGKGARPGALKIDGVPASFLIDQEGRLVGRLEGAAEWDSPEALALIDYYLKAPQAAPAPTEPAAYHPADSRDAGSQRVGVGFSPL